MPKELHRKLARAADKQGLKGKEKRAYVYGTMTRIKKKKPKKREKRKKCP